MISLSLSISVKNFIKKWQSIDLMVLIDYILPIVMDPMYLSNELLVLR